MNKHRAALSIAAKPLAAPREMTQFPSLNSMMALRHWLRKTPERYLGERTDVIVLTESLTKFRFIMAKEIAGQIKLQIKGGAANPSPPVGPALGSKGINIMEFCKQFNARTQDKAGKVLPVVITYYSDKSFDFVVKTPPVAIQLLEATKLKSGSAQPNRKKVAEITRGNRLRRLPRTKCPI